MRECWLAHGRLCLSVARSINHAEILTARTDAAAEAAEVAAAEAAAAETAAAVKLPPPPMLPPPQGPPRKPPLMRLARERPRCPYCRKSLAAARAA